MGAAHVYTIGILAFAMSATGLLSQSPDNIVNLPRSMRLYTNHWEALDWVGDHFDGKDADGTVVSKYTVELWTPKAVRFVGVALKLPFKAVFTGSIAPQGGSIVNPSVNVQYDSVPFATNAAYRLLWTEPTKPKPQIPISNSSESLQALSSSASPESRYGSSATASQKPFQSPKVSNQIAKKSFPPPLSPEWHEATGYVPSFDLSGVWRFDGDGEFPAHSIQFFQLRTQILGVVVGSVAGSDGSSRLLNGVPPEYPSLFVDINSDGTFLAKVNKLNDQNEMQFFAIPFRVDDQNHVHLGIDEFHRLTTLPSHDVACDTRNPLHVGGQEAWLRGRVYERLKDYGSANCWFYIGALQGNARAQGSYADELKQGLGLTKDVRQSFFWYQQGAMQADWVGETNLAQMFREGDVIPRSDQRAKFWNERALTKYGKLTLPPDWALWTSGTCDVRSQGTTDPADALKQGRIAFEAHAMDSAFCWFQISSDGQNVKANTYLAMLYAFGWGVPKNLETSFIYMKKAAEGGDFFAMSFLARFYRYGIGTAKDVDEGSVWFYKVHDSGPAQRAWDLTMGRGNDWENLINFLSAQPGPERSQEKVDCLQNIKRQGYSDRAADEACSEVGNNEVDILGGGQAQTSDMLEHPEEIYADYSFHD